MELPYKKKEFSRGINGFVKGDLEPGIRTPDIRLRSHLFGFIREDYFRKEIEADLALSIKQHTILLCDGDLKIEGIRPGLFLNPYLFKKSAYVIHQRRAGNA